ncbi:MAG: sulfurtransferase TusA family protein, partial [Gammaproteobacteria bacterium]
IAKLMADEGLAEIRTTQDQNLILINVPEARLEAIRGTLALEGLGEPTVGDDVVACPGTSTCRLGITSSKIVGAKLNGSAADLRIRVSGCHNGCAQPETGDIGIYGEGNRLNGKLIPHYQMYFGGDGRAFGGLGFKGPSIPAARIETAVARVQQTYLDDHQTGESFFQWTRRRGKESFTELLADLKAVAPEDMPSVMNDHGDAVAFKVLQLGGGECAGAAQELVASNFSEAAYERSCRNAFMYQHKQPQALECAEAIVRLIGNSLLFISGHTKVDDVAEMARLLKELQAERPQLSEKLASINQALEHLKENPDEAAFNKLMTDLDAWTIAVAQTSQEIDKQLDLTATLPMVAGQAQSPVIAAMNGAGVKAAERTQTMTVDLSTYGCPVHYLKARMELGKIKDDGLVDFLLQSGESVQQVSSSLAEDGHSILASVEEGGNTRITVRKAKAAAQQPA